MTIQTGINKISDKWFSILCLTADDQEAKWTTNRIQAGIIWQNDWFVDGVNLPGSGYKRSGYRRDGGIDATCCYNQTKGISKR